MARRIIYGFNPLSKEPLDSRTIIESGNPWDTADDGVTPAVLSHFAIFTGMTVYSIAEKKMYVFTAEATQQGDTKVFTSAQIIDESNWVHLSEQNSDTNTTYSAGTGLSLDGTTFSVNYGTTAGTALAGNTHIPNNPAIAWDGTSLSFNSVSDAETTALAFRTFIGAGTSNLALGTTSDTALAGNTHLGYLTIQAAGTNLTQRSTLDFGNEFTTSDTGSKTTVTINSIAASKITGLVDNNTTYTFNDTSGAGGVDFSTSTDANPVITASVDLSGYQTNITNAASSSNNSGRTYIQDITLDGNGHVTGISTATETVVDTDTQLSLNDTTNQVFSVSSKQLVADDPGGNRMIIWNDASDANRLEYIDRLPSGMLPDNAFSTNTFTEPTLAALLASSGKTFYDGSFWVNATPEGTDSDIRNYVYIYTGPDAATSGSGTEAVASDFHIINTSFELQPANSTMLGGIQLYAADPSTDKRYRVELDSNNRAYVDVAWEDTTYTAGDGISISSEEISVDETYGFDWSNDHTYTNPISTDNTEIRNLTFTAGASPSFDTVLSPSVTGVLWYAANPPANNYGELYDKSATPALITGAAEWNTIGRLDLKGTARTAFAGTDTLSSNTDYYLLFHISQTQAAYFKGTVIDDGTDLTFNVDELLASDGSLPAPENNAWRTNNEVNDRISTTAWSQNSVHGTDSTSLGYGRISGSIVDSKFTGRSGKISFFLADTASENANVQTTATLEVAGETIIFPQLSPAENQVLMLDVTDKSVKSSYLWEATSSLYGGIKIGGSNSDPNLALQLDDNGNAYTALPARLSGLPAALPTVANEDQDQQFHLLWDASANNDAGAFVWGDLPAISIATTLADVLQLNNDELQPAITETTDRFIFWNGTKLTDTDQAGFKTELALNNVDNVSINSWAGSTNIATIGTITNDIKISKSDPKFTIHDNSGTNNEDHGEISFTAGGNDTEYVRLAAGVENTNEGYFKIYLRDGSNINTEFELDKDGLLLQGGTAKLTNELIQKLIDDNAHGTANLTLNWGTGLSGSNITNYHTDGSDMSATVALDLSELTTRTTAASDSKIPISVANATEQITLSNIKLSYFNNDLDVADSIRYDDVISNGSLHASNNSYTGTTTATSNDSVTRRFIRYQYNHNGTDTVYYRVFKNGSTDTAFANDEQIWETAINGSTVVATKDYTS